MEFIFLIEREKLVDILSEINLFSLTMDGNTDDSVTEQETIFIRTCVQGNTITRFVCIGEHQSTISEDLFAFVNEKLNENYLTNHMSKFVGFGCDGASNMMGCKTGLLTRLQECYPEVVGVHCLCHRLELSFCDVFTDVFTYLILIFKILFLKVISDWQKFVRTDKILKGKNDWHKLFFFKNSKTIQ